MDLFKDGAQNDDRRPERIDPSFIMKAYGISQSQFDAFHLEWQDSRGGLPPDYTFEVFLRGELARKKVESGHDAKLPADWQSKIKPSAPIVLSKGAQELKSLIDKAEAAREQVADSNGSDGGSDPVPVSTVHSNTYAGMELVKLLGKGVSGETWLARKDGELLDVKIPYGSISQLERELSAVKLINHASVPAIVAFQLEEEPYIARKHVDAQSLRDALSGKTYNLSEALVMIEYVLSALESAHESGVLHRDVKPENILVNNTRAYVIDFGLATREVKESLSVSLTDEKVLGTANYMAPESEKGEHSKQSDLYSAAVVLFEMVTGENPKKLGLEAIDVLYDSLGKSEKTEEFVRVMKKALAKNPKNRYRSARELRDALFSIDEVVEVSEEGLEDEERQIATTERHAMEDDARQRGIAAIVYGIAASALLNVKSGMVYVVKAIVDWYYNLRMVDRMFISSVPISKPVYGAERDAVLKVVRESQDAQKPVESAPEMPIDDAALDADIYAALRAAGIDGFVPLLEQEGLIDGETDELAVDKDDAKKDYPRISEPALSLWRDDGVDWADMARIADKIIASDQTHKPWEKHSDLNETIERARATVEADEQRFIDAGDTPEVAREKVRAMYRERGKKLDLRSTGILRDGSGNHVFIPLQKKGEQDSTLLKKREPQNLDEIIAGGMTESGLGPYARPLTDLELLSEKTLSQYRTLYKNLNRNEHK